MAALQTSTSMAPSSASPRPTIDSTAAASPMSASAGTTRAPALRHSSATACSSSPLTRVLSTRSAPSPANASAIARPMLRLAPVISAVLPSRLLRLSAIDSSPLRPRTALAYMRTEPHTGGTHHGAFRKKFNGVRTGQRRGRRAGDGVPAGGVRLDVRRARHHGCGGLHGGRLTGAPAGPHWKPAAPLRAVHRAARTGLRPLGPRRPARARHRGGHLRRLRGPDRRDPVGPGAGLYRRLDRDDVRRDGRHVRRAGVLRHHHRPQPGRRGPVLLHGADRPRTGLNRLRVLAQRRPAVPHLGDRRDRLHRPHRVRRPAPEADGAGPAPGAERLLCDRGRPVALSRLPQPLPVPAALPRRSSELRPRIPRLPAAVSRGATASPGRPERWGGWGAISGPPI